MILRRGRSMLFSETNLTALVFVEVGFYYAT
jgi:hypothetical protein